MPEILPWESASRVRFVRRGREGEDRGSKREQRDDGAAQFSAWVTHPPSDDGPGVAHARHVVEKDYGAVQAMDLGRKKR